MKKKASPPAMPVANNARVSQPADAPLPPADKGMESYLRRYYVKPIPLTGDLPACAQALAATIQMNDGQPLKVDAQTNGDAPVHVKLNVSLPAWTMLEIMALQSGTEAVVTGKSVVLREAKKPLPLAGSLHADSPGPVLRAALGMPPDFGKADDKTPRGDQSAEAELLCFEDFAGEAFGSPLKFRPHETDAFTYHGKPRPVRVLAKVCGASPRAPQQLQWNMVVFTLPHELFETTLAEHCPGKSSTPTGLFLNDGERQMLVRALSMKEGVDMLALPIPASEPGHNVEWTSNPEKVERKRDELSVVLRGLITSTGEVAVNLVLTTEEWNESSQGWSTHDLSTQTSLQPGQTIVLGGLIGEDRKETVHFVSAKVVDTTGLRKPEALVIDLLGNDPDKPPAQTATDDLPYGVPVAGKPGFVRSPYAEGKGYVDVTGLARGTRVKCPFTGKHFRVP